jgi:hypothetical protein
MQVLATHATHSENRKHRLEPPTAGHRSERLEMDVRPRALEPLAILLADDQRLVFRRGGREELAEGYPQRVGDLLKRAERRSDLPVLELRDEARRESRLGREGANRNVTSEAQPADVLTDDVRVDAHAHVGFLPACRPAVLSDGTIPRPRDIGTCAPNQTGTERSAVLNVQSTP